MDITFTLTVAFNREKHWLIVCLYSFDKIYFWQKADKNILYPAASVFVNLTNSYEKPDIMPEMIELAKYSKQHVPEDHEKVRATSLII